MNEPRRIARLRAQRSAARSDEAASFGVGRVGRAREPVRIVVAEPSPRQGGGKLGTVEALRRIGRGVRIEVVHDAAAAIELARSNADLVVAGPRSRRRRRARARGAAAQRSAGRDRDARGDRRRRARDLQVRRRRLRDRERGLRRSAARRRARADPRLARRFGAPRGAPAHPLARAAARGDRRPVPRRARRARRRGPARHRESGVRARLPRGRRRRRARRSTRCCPPTCWRAPTCPSCSRARAPVPRARRASRTRATASSARAFDVRAERLDAEGRILLVLADVTERERLAKNVRDLRRYMENIIQNMYSGLVVVDEAGRVAASNPMAEQILGEPRRLARGSRASGAGSGPLRSPTAASRARSREGARLRGAEGVVQRADGKSVPVAISSSPLVDADGTRMRRRRDLPGRLGDRAAPVAGAAHGEDGVARTARGGRRARDQQPDGLRARESGADGGVPRRTSARLLDAARRQPRALRVAVARTRRRDAARRFRSGDPRIPGGIGAHPPHRPGSARLRLPRRRRVGRLPT